jgi:site-specific DNA-methyltransferase (adenine-specific)
MNSDSGNLDKVPDFLGDTRDQRSFAYWSTLWYAETLRASKEGAMLFTFTDWRQLPSTCDAVQAGGWVWRGIVPWNKTEATRPQSGRPRAQCEYCVFATNGPHAPWEGAPVIPGFFECATSRERVHITEKPIGLMVDMLSLVPPGGLVLDPFCGSGSTGVAAVRLGLRALLFELSPEIAEIARKRLAAEAAHSTTAAMLRGQQALFGTENG